MTVKVFISSVTYALRDERDGLAALLGVVEPYVPLRFEDFAAQAVSPRQACLDAVKDCDVYVLLLGPRYGEPLPDSGLSPTEEEFTQARRLGKPMLVFSKVSEELDEPRQAEFRARVEGYVQGRFRRSFSDVQELNVEVIRALRDLQANNPPPAWTAVDAAPTVHWLSELQGVADPSVYAPVLEVHLLPTGHAPALASAFVGIEERLAREGRASGFFTERDRLELGAAGEFAWAWVRDDRGHGRRSFGGSRTDHTYRGLVRVATRQSSAFAALPTDAIGALTNQDDLTARSRELLAEAVRGVPNEGGVAIAAALGPMDRLFEGDPNTVGLRTAGPLRTRQVIATMPPALSVLASSVRGHPDEVAAEIAAQLLIHVRDSDNR